MYEGGNSMRHSYSMADLTSSDVRRGHPVPRPRGRSGSSGALLDIPYRPHPGQGPKRLSTPNLAELANKISRAELAKHLRLGSPPNKDDGTDHPPAPSPRQSSRAGSQVSIDSIGRETAPQALVDTRQPSPSALGSGQVFEMGSLSPGDPPKDGFSTPHPGTRYNRSVSPSADRIRANSLPINRMEEDGLVPRSATRAISPLFDARHGSLRREVPDPRGLFNSPSLSDLKNAKQQLRSREHRGGPVSPGRRKEYGNCRDVDNRDLGRSPHIERNSLRSSRSLADVRSAESGPGSGLMYLSPDRSNGPGRGVGKRYSVPDLLDADLGDFRKEMVSNDIFKRRLTAGDVFETLEGHHLGNLPHNRSGHSRSLSGNFNDFGGSRHSFRTDASSNYASIRGSSSPSSSPPPPQPPPPPPPPPPLSSLPPNPDRNSSRSSSLRRMALETLTLTNNNSMNDDSSPRPNHLPSISVTDHEGEEGPTAYSAQNDLSSPKSAFVHLEGQGQGSLSSRALKTNPSFGSVSSDGNNTVGSSSSSSGQPPVYNSVSETSTYAASHKGEAKPDDSRSTITDSGVDEEETKEDPDTWRPYDTFQVSEREAEDDGKVFREILKFLRLVLYLFIICTVLTGTVTSRISLFLLASGISQKGSSQGDYVVLLLFCICFPIAVSWFLSFVKIMFSGKKWPSLVTFFFLLVLELLQIFGVCLLVFRILPVTDFFRGITITMATFQLPALFKLVLMERKFSLGLWDCMKFFTTLLAFATQVGAIVFFLVSPFSGNGVHETIPKGKQPKDIPELSSMVWELPVALVLISLGWWENFVSGEWSFCGKVTLSFKRARKVVQDVRDTSTFLVAPFKIGLVVLMAKFLTGAPFQLPEQPSDDASSAAMFHLDHYGLVYLQIGASILVTYLASLACKLHMQKTAFAFPLLLSPPASLAVVYLQCRYEFIPGSWHTGLWLCPALELQGLVLPLSCAGALWVSYSLVVSHVWFPRNERMAKVEKLFITPHFDAVLPDFHLTLRRRRNDHELRTTRLERFTYVGEDNPYVAEDEDPGDGLAPSPMVYVCATMWHETRREMTQLLKSLFRLDYAHCASKLAQDKFQIKDPDYYDLEVHVIFDDSFEYDDDVDRFVPNIFVRQLIECMEDAARSVVKGPIEIPPPVKTSTPYGGVLVWTMPGQTKMHVHLKNKNFIRHRKRWSQCMYLYYLLGYRLLGGKDDAASDNSESEADSQHAGLRKRGDKDKDKKAKSKVKSKRRKMAAMPLRSLLGHMSAEKYEKTVQMSENTFILTLDGDVDFRPESVRLLLDRMKKNKKVGAVCGRIHPIGSGPMVWYQQFEYAVGHWLQKASEHVFGCVLCCPGCFSLFRGSALMDDNVMKRYTTKPTEASHYIQFEQGEDRWLCTLLLQQGHRIDYSAGADALTFAPETFNEFFNQRRRWSPSTLANMMDLLSSWRETVRMNDNVSRLYIFYQFMLMASSILAPSTVILMITGSYNSVLGLSMTWSFILSLAPVVFYLVICLTQTNDMQIKVGAVLTALYTVVMMIATVGTLISIATENFNSPNVIFLSGLFVIFFVASVLHPQEFFCLVHGALYFMVVPSTFILLTVFYLCNLNNVSWGTREMPKKMTPEEEEAQKRAEEEKARRKKKTIFSLYGLVSLVQELRDAVRGLWGLKKELQEGSGPHHQQQQQQAQAAGDVEKGMPPQPQEPAPQPPVPDRKQAAGIEPNPDSPHWLRLDYLGYGEVGSLCQEEKEFWKFLIKKYLHPLHEDKGQKAKIAEDLVIIRNNVVFIYVMMNFLWCVIALQLQAMQDTLKSFYIVEKYEPMSLVFLAVFALVLTLQFLSMLVHRWGTFLHLMASTRINWFNNSHSEEDFVRYVVSQTKMLQNLEPIPDYDDDDGFGDDDDDDDDDVDKKEEAGMALSDFDPSLHHGYKPRGADPSASPGGGGGAGGEEAGIYETLGHHNAHYQRHHQHTGHPRTPPRRTLSTNGQFPMLKTIFEQNLSSLQQRFQQRGGPEVVHPGRPPFPLPMLGTQRRPWGHRQGDMRQRFFHQNFQMPPQRVGRYFRENPGDMV